MNSLDTSILLYGTNRDCSEHKAARSIIDLALSDPKDWIVPDQVYFELYRLVRSGTVLLRDAGVDRFYTRNTRDFTGFGWFDVVNPID